MYAVTPVLTAKVVIQQQNFNRVYETYFEDVRILKDKDLYNSILGY